MKGILERKEKQKKIPQFPETGTGVHMFRKGRIKLFQGNHSTGWCRVQLVSQFHTPMIKALLLCASLTVPNLLPNMDERKNVEIRANSCWGRDEHHKFFIWTRFFLDNNKIKIWHVQNQVNQVWVIFANDREWSCEVKLNFSCMIWIKKIVSRKYLDTST